MAMRLNDLRLLSAKLNNKNASLAGMIVKLKGTELRHDLESLGIDVLGEIGALYRDERGDAPYLKDHGLYQYHYMFYLGLIIGGGTSQIQKNIISERGLGMPKEPKLNKEA
jgi:alkylation response protein AidB-like acyl-CoA dehydrogenase